MPLFTNCLKRESSLIQSALELMEVYRSTLEAGGSVSTADLRIVVFVLQKTFENSHIAKEEAILYPALRDSERWLGVSESKKREIQDVFRLHSEVRKSLLNLRIAVDDFESNQKQKGLVAWKLGEFVDQSNVYMKREREALYPLSDLLLDLQTQKELFVVSQKFESEHGIERLQSARDIFNRLRLAIGLKAA
jgi:hemerythrin-like domain-containing protein